MSEWKLVKGGLKDDIGFYDSYRCDGCSTEFKNRSLHWNPPRCKCDGIPDKPNHKLTDNEVWGLS